MLIELRSLPRSRENMNQALASLPFIKAELNSLIVFHLLPLSFNRLLQLH